MAKDDYFVIVYKVLVYLYAVLKRKIVFDVSKFEKSIGFKDISEEYFYDILKMMTDDGYITGLHFTKTYGNQYILITDLDNMKITSKGIEYLQDNPKMQGVKEFLVNNADTFVSIIMMVYQSTLQ